MKTNKIQKISAWVTVAGLIWSVSTSLAQDSTGASPAPPAAASPSVPPLAYGVPQILQLAQAKVGDDTIIAYIKNSGNSYGLNADQIIYLRQQGLSDAVITTMLSQPRPAVANPATYAPAPQTSAAQPAAPQAAVSTDYSDQVSTATVAPSVTYVQTVPATTYYYQSYPYYYYPSYAWYPPVSFSFGWYGGGRVGGWYGGGHGGGVHVGFGHGGGGHR